ncbi:MAG: CHAT domain-containing tetratricopeptide repeat protein [Cyanobacteria bacterium J06621_12]
MDGRRVQDYIQEQKKQIYLQIIDMLLNSSSEQTSQILQQNSQLVDEGFLQAVNYYAHKLREDGQEKPTAYLFNLVRQLSQAFESAPENRQQAYLQLIQGLLQCPNGEEGQILESNQELIDAGLIETMQQVAAEFDEQGSNNGNWLRNIAQNLTQYLNDSQSRQAHLNFLLEILRTINAGDEKEQVYPLLQQNLYLVDDNLAQTLQIWASKTLPTLEPEQKQVIGNDIGNFSIFIQEFSLGNRASNLEIAITGYNILLTIRTQQDFPVQWTRINNNLGAAYRDRIKGDKADNLERAIAFFEQALTILTQQNFPIDWATTNNNLAIAYSDRIKGDKADNLERAIAFFEQALTIRTQQDFPVDWAGTNNNLGNAYLYRIKGDKADNLERAIAFFEQALTTYTQQNFPVDWAMTQNNLGNAYLYRIKGDKVDNLERAIALYEQALTTYTQQDFPVEWAGTNNNLGNAYSDRIRGDKAHNLERTIASYEQALTIRTQQDFPINWAMTQNNLGAAYRDRIRGDKAHNLERAIAFFEQALTIRTQQDFPLKWAETNNNLAIAYLYRIRGDKADNLERAITFFEQALTIYTKQDLPIECLRTARNLANLHFKEGNWQSAIDAYALAIEAVEKSREAASNDKNRQEIISNAIDVYQNIVQAYINLKQIDKAIEYVERGKARNLVELLATRDLYPNGDIPTEIIARLDDLKQAAIAEERRLRQQGNSSGGFNGSAEDNRSLATGTSNRDAALDRTLLNRIRQELDNLIAEHISEKDPSFQLTQKVEPISFEEIREVLPTEQTVLVEWFIGNDTLSAFIVTPQQPIPIHVGYTKEKLQTLIESIAMYYGSYLQRDGQWRDNFPQLLTELAQNLQLEVIIDRLKQLVPDCNQLILVPHRWLHLLPIHALPLADGKCLLDLFPQGVSYAPSVQLLELTQKQSKPQLANLFAVQDPTEDLDFTNIEVEAVRSGFRPNDDVLVNQQATKSALTKERLAEANLAHFSCHGYFNFENPELSALLLAGSKVEIKQQEEKGEIRFLPSREGGSVDLEKCLTLGEIFGLDLRNCRLVTLSACETGITDFRSLSDEYIGLPSGFLFAGSPSVVSSLWTVSDLSTTFLMIKFYQNLQEIDSVAIALNQAQLWLRNLKSEEFREWSKDLPLTGNQRFEIDGRFRQDNRPFASPYHWGAFCAVGS